MPKSDIQNIVREFKHAFTEGAESEERVCEAIDLLNRNPETAAHFFRYAQGLVALRLLLAQRETGNDWLSVRVLRREHDAREFLIRTAEEYAADNEEAAKQLHEDIYRKTANAASADDLPDESIGWCLARLLACLPTKNISADDISVFRPWFGRKAHGWLVHQTLVTNLLPRLLDEHAETAACLALIRISTEIRCEDAGSSLWEAREAKTAMDVDSLMAVLYNRREDMQSVAYQIAKKCGIEVVKLLIDRITDAMECNPYTDMNSTIWRHAIAEDERNQSMIDEYLVLTIGLRDAIFGSIEHEHYCEKETKTILKGMIVGKSYVLRRVALHVLDVTYPDFESILRQHMGKRLFEEEMRPEMYRLLNHHFEEFSDRLQRRVISCIQRLESKSKSEHDKLGAKYLMQMWLHGIRGKGNNEADQLYEDLRKETGREPDEPDLSSRIFFRWGAHESPKSAESMPKDSLSELVKWLNEFQESEESFPKDGVTIGTRGVHEALQRAVEAKPDRFWGNGSTLEELRHTYLYWVIEGFTAVWKRGDDLDWQAVLSMCKARLSRDLIEQNDEDSPDFVNAISRLIREGALRGEKPLADETVLNEMRELLAKALPHQRSKNSDSESDAVNRAINSPRGKLIEALILLARRHRMAFGDDGEAIFQPIWQKYYEPFFDEQLQMDGEAGNDYEFRALACRYSPTLLYIRREWLTKHLDEVFSKPGTDAWRAAMDGYTFLTSVYEVLYRKLDESGHIQAALNDELYRDRFVEYIVVAYTADWEKLDDEDSLIRYVLNDWKQEDIENIVSFFRRHRKVDYLKDDSDRLKAPAINLWRWCFENVPDDKPEKAGILTKLTQLSCYLDEIDNESKKWLLEGVKGYGDIYSKHQLIVELDRLAAISAGNVAAVLDVITQEEPFPHVDREFQSLLVKLRDAGQKQVVDTVIERYLRLGHDPARLGPAYEA